MDEITLKIVRLYIKLDETNKDDVSKLCKLLKIEEQEAIDSIILAKEMWEKYDL